MRYIGISQKNNGSQITSINHNNFLYELSGQSNASPMLASALPAELSGNLTGIHIYSILTSSWETLNATVNSACMEDLVTNEDRCGIEMRLGYLLRALFETDIYFIKYARDGTELALTANTDWNTGSTNEVYTRSNTNHNAALSALGDLRPPRAYIWIHGEADTTNTTWTNAYENNLRTFISSKRGIYGHPEMPFIIVRLSDNQTALDPTRLNTVQSAQTTVASELNNYLVDTNDLAVNGDGLHYPYASIDVIANRIYDILLTLNDQV